MWRLATRLDKAALDVWRCHTNIVTDANVLDIFAEFDKIDRFYYTLQFRLD